MYRMSNDYVVDADWVFEPGPRLNEELWLALETEEPIATILSQFSEEELTDWASMFPESQGVE